MNKAQKDNYYKFLENERLEAKDKKEAEQRLVRYAKYIKGLSTGRLLFERRYNWYYETAVDLLVMQKEDDMVYAELAKREHVSNGPERKVKRRERAKQKRNGGRKRLQK